MFYLVFFSVKMKHTIIINKKENENQETKKISFVHECECYRKSIIFNICLSGIKIHFPFNSDLK